MIDDSWKRDPQAVDLIINFSQGLACGSTFLACTWATQAILGGLRISAASPSSVPAGLLAIFASSSLAAVVADRSPDAVSNALSLPRRRRRRLDPAVAWTKAVQHGILGVVLFHVLGGRLNALAPSNVARLGAFHRHRASLGASLEYASSYDRGKIAMLGRSFGCHTCGTRRATDYIADHMPPIKVAMRLNKSWWRRLAGIKVVQRYVPQCKACSGIQSGAVRDNKFVLVYHYGSLRVYHGTGLLLPAAYESTVELGLWPRPVADALKATGEYIESVRARMGW